MFDQRPKHLSPTRSIRSRLALLGTLLFFVFFAAGGLAFDRLLAQQLENNLDLRVNSQAVDRASAIAAGLDPATQLATAQRETAVAVFDASGNLLAGRGFGDPTSVADLAPGATETRNLLLVEADEDEVERTDVRVAAAQSGDVVVVVAAEKSEIGETLGEARRLLLVAIPIASLAGGVLIWFIVGRSIAPVERIRRDAQAIAEVGAGGRVHQPEHSDELGRLASTMNDMLERLDHSAATLRRFVSDSSHEIRSPIANIRARIETSRAEDWEHVRTDVVGEVERVEAIVADLTYLARSDEGRIEHRRERIEVDDLLFSEAARLQQSGRVTVDASDVEPVVIMGDLGQIRRVIRNLVDNAERHAAGQLRLSVRAIDTDDTSVAMLEVDDDGPGIAVDQRDLVFERFARLDESRERRAGGTGLGLAIVRDIADRHDGTIEVLDAPLGGARFRVHLPMN
jgi:signal transduction histidine kinase